MEEVKMFNVESVELFGNYVMVKNPVKNELNKAKFDKMPKALQGEVLQKAANAFYSIEVLKVGDECKRIEVGDFIFITNEIAAGGIFVDDVNYILLRETQILGKNVGTQENI